MGDRLRGHEWFTVRDRVLARDDGECQNCGVRSNLVVHHVVPVAKGGTNRLSNLLTLCRDCHRSAHGYEGRENTSTSTTAPERKIFTVDEIATVCGAIRHPLELAIIVTLAKTGVGVGELCNLSMADIDMRGIEGGEIAELEGPGLRVRYGGEIPYSNRRERQQETVIPIDNELETVLRRWFAIRPDPVTEGTVFVGTKERWGERVEPSSIRYSLQRIGEQLGYYQTNFERENLTPLALRYFFEERFRGEPHHREYILGRRSPEAIDFSALERGYRKTIFSLLQ